MYTNWHSHEIDKVLSQLKTSQAKGLSSVQAKRKLAHLGPNKLPKERPLSKTRLFFEQFNNSLVFILLFTVAASFFLGHYSDSAFILIVILINTTVSFYQENKANDSLNALQEMVRIKTKALRDGGWKELDSEKLVPGDVISMNPGDKVPADCRIMEASDLKVNEASLTGEWLAVEKKSGVLDRETELTDRNNMLFMGTAIEVGEAKAVVVKTGSNTEFGRIVTLVKRTDEPKTPLQKKIGSLSQIVAIFVIGMIAVIMVEGYLSGENFVDIFITSLALAVSAIPEGLLPAITVVLVFAMRRILKQKGIVKRLAAAEGLGSVTVVCSDKTGTLTEGKMIMSHVVTGAANLLPKERDHSECEDEGNQSDAKALTIAMLTNDAYIENPEDELHKWKVRGYYTDKALLMSGVHAGLDILELEDEYRLVDKQSFSSHRRYALSLREKDRQQHLFVVGAPEELIGRSRKLFDCGKEIEIDDNDKKSIQNSFGELTAKGLRVVACAFREVGDEDKSNLDVLADSLVFVGFIALKDPVRADAREAIIQIKKAGVRPVIITGDHKQTALAVAHEVGMEVSGKDVLEGSDIERLSSAALKKRSRTVSIYARALPEHKLNIIKALHQNGEVVAMFGDGVNDAPALKASDIGVAVGSGTDVAKEVADVILLDDNFKTIVKAIEQGRVAFANIRKVFIYLVADDFTELLLFFLAMILGLPLPLLAVQILWINLVEDGLPGIALTAEQETEGVMEEKPRDPAEPILSKNIKRWMLAIFSINGIITFAFFWLVYNYTANIELTRTLLFILVAFDSLAFAYSVRSLKRSIFRKDIFSNKALNWAVLVSFALLLIVTYTPWGQDFAGTVPLSMFHWGIIAAVTFVEIVVIEIFKKLCFRKN